MRVFTTKKNPNFIGRSYELEKIKALRNADEAAILIVYGRRRVGKTELLEQAFIDRNILKFEGIEGLSEQDQQQQCLEKLAFYAEDKLIAKLKIKSWLEFFELLADYVKNGTWTIYLEELQWLANYQPTLIAELKHAWDNNFRYNNKLILILCGSSPSFMIDQVIHSKALYNRSQTEIHLQEFNILEAKQFMPKRSNREIFDAYLTIGGIPEYLKWVNKESSIFLGLCKNSFCPNTFFVNEYDKIFTSSLAANKYYRQIIKILSKNRFAPRNYILKQLEAHSGGKITDLLDDLEKCGFIEKYHPYNAGEHSILVRYNISDNYLQFYNKFIAPIKKNINNGDYVANAQLAIRVDSYQKWLGFSFERWCRKNHMLIARILGFSNVQYTAGTYFNRASQRGAAGGADAGFQIDLLFDRADNVVTICEIKYLINQVTAKVISDFEQKIALFNNKKNKTIHKVLITSSEPDNNLKNKGFFDRIITLDLLLQFAAIKAF